MLTVNELHDTTTQCEKCCKHKPKLRLISISTKEKTITIHTACLIRNIEKAIGLSKHNLITN